jgi:lysozyme family protein
MSPLDTLIDEVIQRESVKDTNDPNDPGGRTKFGISQKWNPSAWLQGPPTLDTARQVYRTIYIVTPGFSVIQPAYLMNQVVDFGVLSGPVIAAQAFQRVVGVTVDGKVGPDTIDALVKLDPVMVNNQLVAARVLSLIRVVQKRPSDLEYAFGWANRALSFLR